uniref:Palmitoyltransferase n=1 Tax=Globisporangium ultimum (strain ATCC 200006 / CBS 805.95 / DAOM BR144) TaxID=431595 RepID=K3WKJ1_GLOUD
MSSLDMRRKERACGTGFNVRLWCNKDPCGLICAALSWFLVLYAECVVVGVVIYPWMGLSLLGLVNIAAFTVICFLALVSHGKAMLTDPGAVPQSALPLAMADASKEDIARIEEQKYRTCRRCRQFKPGRAHHCSICDRCVIKMDHHCPWVNNCVGLGNHKFFLLFIFYVFILSLYALVLVSLRYARCINDNCPSSGAIRVVFLVLEAVLFGLFTMCMMCDQYSVITTGATQIDRLKGEVTDNLGIREVFGGASRRFSLHWLLPVNIWFPTSLKNQILGYVLEEELLCSDDELTEADSFLPDTPDSLSVTMTETLEGGWSVEKRVPSGGSAAEIV